VTGIKAWAASVNAQGGVNGHQVDLVIENDSASAGTSISEVERLINQDHVVAIGQISDVDSSWASYASQAHIPVIGLGSEDTNDFTNPNFFSPGLTNDAGPAALVEAMKLMHVTKLGLMYCVEAAICSAGIPSEEQYAKAHGIQVAYVTGISGSAPNYVAQCLAAKQTGVQALAIGTGNSEIQSVRRAARCRVSGGLGDSREPQHRQRVHHGPQSLRDLVQRLVVVPVVGGGAGGQQRAIRRAWPVSRGHHQARSLAAVIGVSANLAGADLMAWREVAAIRD